MQDIENLRIAGVIADSIVDGPGLRYVIFVQGCCHKCENCHNPETHDFEGGTSVTPDRLANIILSTKMKGVTFSGGEPFCQAKKLAVTAELVKRAKDVSFITYTGYTFEELLEMAKENKGVHDLLSVTDYLIDGRYIHEERSPLLRFRGSRNQRILDVTCYPNSIKAREVQDENF